MCASSQRISLPLCQIWSVFLRLIGGSPFPESEIITQGYGRPARLEFDEVSLIRRIDERRWGHRPIVLARIVHQTAAGAFPHPEEQEGNHCSRRPEIGAAPDLC